MKDCPICLDSCEKDFIVTECCHNHFHTSCHTECMKVKNSCPTCRHVVIEVEPHFVEVRISCIPYRVILFWVASMLLLCFFCGFIMYTLISQYINQGLNNTNSTNVTTTDVHN